MKVRQADTKDRWSHRLGIGCQSVLLADSSRSVVPEQIVALISQTVHFLVEVESSRINDFPDVLS